MRYFFLRRKKQDEVKFSPRPIDEFSELSQRYNKEIEQKLKELEDVVRDFKISAKKIEQMKIEIEGRNNGKK